MEILLIVSFVSGITGFLVNYFFMFRTYDEDYLYNMDAINNDIAMLHVKLDKILSIIEYR